MRGTLRRSGARVTKYGTNLARNDFSNAMSARHMFQPTYEFLVLSTASSLMALDSKSVAPFKVHNGCLFACSADKTTRSFDLQVRIEHHCY